MRRGIAEASRKTNGWIFSCGDSNNQGARAAGRAMVYAGNIYGEDSPCIGVLSSERVREVATLKEKGNGKVHKLPAPVRAESSKVDLEPQHTHFIMVDGNQQQAEHVRDKLEFFISSQDVSDDGIQTPKLLLVVGGDASTLRWVHSGLDADDPATLTSVPVLVVADSGGAAKDIYNYCCPDSGQFQKMPTVGDAAYLEACKTLLPEIEAMGKLTGQNTTPQMSFFKVDSDPDAENDLTLAIKEALQNDCPEINQEAMLAVAWGDAVILQRLLENAAESLLDTVAKKGQAATEGKRADDLLQIALQHCDVEVVRTLLGFKAEPSHVVMDELFQEKFNRYPVKETDGLWRKAKAKKRAASAGAAKKAADRAKSLLSKHGGVTAVVPADSVPPPLSSTRTMKLQAQMDKWKGWGYAQQVLAKMIGAPPHARPPHLTPFPTPYAPPPLLLCCRRLWRPPGRAPRAGVGGPAQFHGPDDVGGASGAARAGGGGLGVDERPHPLRAHGVAGVPAPRGQQPTASRPRRADREPERV
jgi:hypothetical protein